MNTVMKIQNAVNSKNQLKPWGTPKRNIRKNSLMRRFNGPSILPVILRVTNAHSKTETPHQVAIELAPLPNEALDLPFQLLDQ